MPRRSKKSEREAIREREEGFDSRFHLDRLPKYDSLKDRAMRSHFENPRRLNQLHKMGFIDSEGRVIDVDRAQRKISIIEQEFKAAEEAEKRRLQEEKEIRDRVQKKRFQALERARRDARLAKMREDRRLRQEILKAQQEAMLGRPLPKKDTHTSAAAMLDAPSSADEEAEAAILYGEEGAYGDEDDYGEDSMAAAGGGGGGGGGGGSGGDTDGDWRGD